MIRPIAAAIALACATPALAGPDSMWVNPGGGLSGLRLADDPVVPLVGGGNTIAEIVQGFDDLCMNTNFDKLAVNPVIVRSIWRGSYMPSVMTLKTGEVDLGGWQGDSHFLGILDHPVFSPNPQCIFVVATKVDNPASEVFPYLTQRYGLPANYEQIADPLKNPSDDIRPFWVFDRGNGRERYLTVRNLSRGDQHRIHFTLMERPVGSPQAN